VDQGCVCKEDSLGRLSTGAETTDRVQQAYLQSHWKWTIWASCDLNLPQIRAWKILPKSLALGLQML